jgi:hypothetical protein
VNSSRSSSRRWTRSDTGRQGRALAPPAAAQRLAAQQLRARRAAHSRSWCGVLCVLMCPAECAGP